MWRCRSMPRKAPQILIVDDDVVTCEMLCEVFAHEGFEASFKTSSDDALAQLHSAPADVLLTDIRMGSPLEGFSLLDSVRHEYPSTPVVLMTAFGSIESAIRAVKDGAYDYLSKPFDIDELVATVRRALDGGSNKQPGAVLDNDGRTVGLIGRTPAMLEVYKMIARVADSTAAVLV